MSPVVVGVTMFAIALAIAALVALVVTYRGIGR